MLPFRGQLSGRQRLPVTHDLCAARSKHNGVMKTYFVAEATAMIEISHASRRHSTLSQKERTSSIRPVSARRDRLKRKTHV
jgi:hypothetical protein